MKYVILYILLLAFVFLLYNWVYIGPQLKNIFDMWIIFGKPGSGKSTVLQKIMYKAVKKGWIVYYDGSTFIKGVKSFDTDAFKKGKWLPDGRKGHYEWYDATNKEKHGEINQENKKIMLCFDEIGILYNNRDFKNAFTPDTLAWWKLHRHKRIAVRAASQTYKDMDLKLRQLTDQNYLMHTGIITGLRSAKRIIINFDIMNSDNGDSAGGQIIEAYRYDLPFFHIYLWMPKWIRMFNSHS